MTSNELTLTLTVDADADAGYIDAGQNDVVRPVARSIPIQTDDGHVYGCLDLAADGSLLGIELLGLRTLLPRAEGA